VKMDRRKFLEHMARGGLLAALMLVAGLLVRRGQLTPGNSCSLSGRCADCRIVQKCSLPQAEKERRKTRG